LTATVTLVGVTKGFGADAVPYDEINAMFDE
jgi:hypothetical protein